MKFDRVFRFNINYSAYYVTLVYLLVKTAYLANVLINFSMMNYFLSTKQTLKTHSSNKWYGWHILGEILNGTEWDLSGFFPRVTVCDFEVSIKNQV